MAVTSFAATYTPGRRSRNAVPYILFVAAGALSAVLCVRLSPLLGVFATVSAFILMALPGVFAGMAIFGWDIRNQPESLLFGVPIGLMISGYVALMIGFLVRWSVPLIVFALLLLAAISCLWALRYRGFPLASNFRPWKRTDYAVLAGMQLAVLGFVSIPFCRFGELTPIGHAYSWLFGYDFVLRAAYAASITLGLPIDHIHMTGVSLHMYLVGYVLPAFAYDLCGEVIHLHVLLLVTEILLDLMFVGCLFAFLRLFAGATKALVATAILGLLAYSYYGWFVIARHFLHGPVGNLGASPQRLAAFGSVSHLYQRLFMVEPQAILALSVFLFTITVVLSTDRRMGWALSGFIGLAIGIEFGIDSWLGLTLAAWFAFVWFIHQRMNWRDRRAWLEFSLVVVISVSIWASFFGVHMIGLSSGGLVSIRPYWWGFKFGIFQYAIEYGPMLPLGAIGLWLLWRKSPLLALSVASIGAFAISQDLFVSIAELPHFRSGNRLLPLTLLAGAAFLFEHVEFSRAKKLLTLSAVALAFPTVVTDIRGASNVLDQHATFYVSSADLEACEWIRTHLPKAAVIQGKPDYIGDYQAAPSVRGANEISLIPAFAFRRSVLGAEYTARSMCAGCAAITKLRESDLDTMFRASSVSVIESSAAKYRIDYFYVGPFEQNQYPGFLGALRSSPRFEQVYDHDSVHIFRILSGGPEAQ